MHRRRFVHSAAAALMIATLAVPAQAQSDRPVTAVVSALALAPMPSAETIEIVSYDDSDLARTIGTVASQTLSANGYQVGSGGQLLLGLELIDQLSLNERDPTIGSTSPGANQPNEAERVNLFADSEDSVLGGRIGPTSPNALQFGIYATLNDRATGRRVWQAEIMADIAGSTREAVGPLLVSAVVERIGRAIAREELVLN